MKQEAQSSLGVGWFTQQIALESRFLDNNISKSEIEELKKRQKIEYKRFFLNFASLYEVIMLLSRYQTLNWQMMV